MVRRCHLHHICRHPLYPTKLLRRWRESGHARELRLLELPPGHCTRQLTRREEQRQQLERLPTGQAVGGELRPRVHRQQPGLGHEPGAVRERRPPQPGRAVVHQQPPVQVAGEQDASASAFRGELADRQPARGLDEG